MGKALQEHSEGAIFHATAHANPGQTVFANADERRRFLARLRRLKGELGFKVLGFCLMGNHLHLIIRVRTITISEIMQRLLAGYSRQVNETRVSSGNLFQTRFGRRLCESERYLLGLIRYVSLNPVKDGFVKLPQQWPWSSHRAYLGEDDGITDAKEVREILGMTALELRGAYLSSIADGLERLAELKPLPDEADSAKELVERHSGRPVCEAAAELLRRGYSQRAVAQAIGTSPMSVSRLARKLGLLQK